ncbi:MAG TPA: Rap1a/Tai family immunity protein [Rhodospirillales bacterium]|nr:Rap1a/Tai family immunity protein [Rhodospirillales bacterium]
MGTKGMFGCNCFWNAGRIGAGILAAALLTAMSWENSAKAAVGATFNTGERLYSWCMSAEKSERDLCSAYIAAVADVLAYGPVGTYRACLPRQEVKFSKVHEAAAKWLESHPEDRHFSAVGLVARALSESFPCQ